MAFVAGSNFFRRTTAYDLTTSVPTFGTEVYYMVRTFDDVEVMFDNEHRIARVNEAREHFKELAHIVEMKARGRFVKDIEGLPCLAALQFARQFYALRFTT